MCITKLGSSDSSVRSAVIVLGQLPKTRSIIINPREKDEELGDQELRVTENLYRALLHLQDDDIPQVIWADAVCINQLNLREKEIQIPLMAEIYAKASQVIAWLGEARDGSDEALNVIRVAAEPSFNISKKRLPPQSLSVLLERSWFRRIWVSTIHVILKRY
jgi:hypothetical protein